MLAHLRRMAGGDDPGQLFGQIIMLLSSGYVPPMSLPCSRQQLNFPASPSAKTVLTRPVGTASLSAVPRTGSVVLTERDSVPSSGKVGGLSHAETLVFQRPGNGRAEFRGEALERLEQGVPVWRALDHQVGLA
jgi:hypothetical protein